MVKEDVIKKAAFPLLLEATSTAGTDTMGRPWCRSDLSAYLGEASWVSLGLLRLLGLLGASKGPTPGAGHTIN